MLASTGLSASVESLVIIRLWFRDKQDLLPPKMAIVVKRLRKEVAFRFHTLAAVRVGSKEPLDRATFKSEGPRWLGDGDLAGVSSLIIVSPLPLNVCQGRRRCPDPAKLTRD